MRRRRQECEKARGVAEEPKEEEKDQAREGVEEKKKDEKA